MKDTSRTDDWRSLCEKASKETDPLKLVDLITKINRILEECHQQNRPEEASSKIDTVLLPINKRSECDYDLYRFPGECAPAIEYDC